MEFGRVVSIFFLVVYVYVYCYLSIIVWYLNFEVIDWILVNFNNMIGIFNCIFWSKLLVVFLLVVFCLGMYGVKGEKIIWFKIYVVLVVGCVLFFLNWWFFKLLLLYMVNIVFYIFIFMVGYFVLLMLGLWMSCFYRYNFMEDVFNMENESFM